ncbi:MAG: hypothetical protein J5527_03775 [Treponema sp.]|nr:hypothetical protein [Treponema sp.]
MRKFLSQFIKLLVAAAIVFCGVSCANDNTEPSDNSNPKENSEQKDNEDQKGNEVSKDSYESLIVGTWFWNYGYDQEQFCNEQVTFYKDGKIEFFSIGSDYALWQKGDWSIIDDSKYGPTMLQHFTQGKNKLEDEWQPGDLKRYYAIKAITNNEIEMYRYKLESITRGIVQEFDPPVLNHYTRIKDGTKENLIGKWIFNKNCRSVAWEESWVFNEDNTIQVFTLENGLKEDYKGTYSVEKTETGSVLHQVLNQISENNSEFKELNPPMEFWYDYKIDNDNLINVNTIKIKINGEEHIYDPGILNFYYRDIPLETVIYHWNPFAKDDFFNDYYPTGTDYDILGLDKSYLFFGVPDGILNQHLFGWYDNPELNGETIKTISASDSSKKHEYWAKWGLKCNKNVYDPANGKYNYDITAPYYNFVPYNMTFPAKEKTLTIKFSGKANKKLSVYWGLSLVDTSDDWDVIGNDWHSFTSNEDGTFSDVFKLTMTKDFIITNHNNICFNLCYNPDSLDEPIIIEDYKFEVIDE